MAHNAQIDLSNMISSLSTEPNSDPVLIRNAFRYLVYSHSQLSYISALGSHREQVSDPQILQLLSACQQTLTSALSNPENVPQQDIQGQLAEIRQLSQQEHISTHLLLVLKQISLLLETLPELLSLRQQLLVVEIK